VGAVRVDAEVTGTLCVSEALVGPCGAPVKLLMSDSKLEATSLGNADSKTESALVVVTASSAMALDRPVMVVEGLPERCATWPIAARRSCKVPLPLFEVEVEVEVASKGPTPALWFGTSEPKLPVGADAAVCRLFPEAEATLLGTTTRLAPETR